MAKNNDLNQKDASKRNVTNIDDDEIGENIGTGGNGIAGAAVGVGTFVGAVAGATVGLDTFAGAVAGAALGNQVGEGLDSYAKKERVSGDNGDAVNRTE